MTEIMKFALDMVSSGIIVIAFGIFLVTMKKAFDQIVIWIENGEI